MSLLMPDVREPNRHQSPEQSAARLLELVRRRDRAGRPGQARILLNHARMRTPSQPRPAWLSKPQPNACYANSLTALSSPHATGFTYVEGYAYQAELDIAYEHAWLEDQSGCVVETTWPCPAQAYLGLRLPVETLLDLLGDDDSEPFLFGDWARDFTMLRAHAACCSFPWMLAARAESRGRTRGSAPHGGVEHDAWPTRNTPLT